ncbi:helix-turn-helix transcriptional regulator [Streptomyces sp. NPDC002994]|uniref:helix-turn-helix domain-containing protein n=1 Tax=Streptomyces sp. NPDC002994 TaxID=3154441 RepID=UPI0033ACA1DB
MTAYNPPTALPRNLLERSDVRTAIAAHDFGTVFRIARSEAGISYSKIAAECGIKPERVGSLARGVGSVTTFDKVVQIADALRIPGHMLGLMCREWEEAGSTPPSTALLTASLPSRDPAADGLWVGPPDDDLTDPEFAAALIESQLPQHYKSANYFGARQPLAMIAHHAKTIDRLLEEANGSTRRELLRIGGRTAEFLGWLYQDLGDFRAAGYWSDRAMEWAQEAADDHMQSYVLLRKSHQAASQANAERTIGLARAAQRVPNLISGISALAAQQEAAGYALQNNPKAALAKFDEARELASQPKANDPASTLDTSYCTPAYIEIQRANCWIDLGDPLRAVQLFEDEIAALPQIYRNDRGVYLARSPVHTAKQGSPSREPKPPRRRLRLPPRPAQPGHSPSWRQ